MASTRQRASFSRLNTEWAARLIAHAGRGSQDVVTAVDGSPGQRAGGMAAVEDGVETPRSIQVRTAELARRADAIAHGDVRGREALGLPPNLTRWIEAAERRARSLARAGGRSDESRRGAAIDFVGAVASAFTLDPEIACGVLSEVVAEAAAAIGISRGAANLAVFQRALASPQVAELPPRLAYRFILRLIVELGPADAVSLWTSPSRGRLECVASAGEAAESRRL